MALTVAEITPGVISLDNALAILPDEYRRTLTAEARSYAEAGKEPRGDFGQASTYWDAIVNDHKRLLWLDTYEKRKARMARVNGPASTRTDRS